MEGDVLSIIKKINADKKAKSISPIGASREEIMSDVIKVVENDLNALYKAKEVSYYKTLNSVAFIAKDLQEQ